MSSPIQNKEDHGYVNLPGIETTNHIKRSETPEIGKSQLMPMPTPVSVSQQMKANPTKTEKALSVLKTIGKDTLAVGGIIGLFALSFVLAPLFLYGIGIFGSAISKEVDIGGGKKARISGLDIGDRLAHGYIGLFDKLIDVIFPPSPKKTPPGQQPSFNISQNNNNSPGFLTIENAKKKETPKKEEPFKHLEIDEETPKSETPHKSPPTDAEKKRLEAEQKKNSNKVSKVDLPAFPDEVENP